jgi:hydrogenase nickel incorporation protein HypA/HybF
VHEHGLVRGLIRKLEEVAHQHRACRVVAARVRLGALAHVSAERFQTLFEEAARGSPAEGCRLEVYEDPRPTAPHAQEVLLEHVELEWEEEPCA